MDRETSSSGSTAAHTRARALFGAGRIAFFQGDYGTAKAFSEEGLDLYRRLEDKEGIASCLTTLGFAALFGQQDDIPVAALLEEVLELRPQLENRRTVAWMLIFAGVAAGLFQEDWDEARALNEEALALSRETRDVQGICTCLYNLGLMAAILGDPTRATVLLRELMRLARRINNKLNTLHAFFGLACVAASEGRTMRAVRLWGVSEALQETDNTHITPTTHAFVSYENRLAAARSQLGEAAFERSWAEGKTMTQDEAVEYALAEEPASKPGPRRRSRRQAPDPPPSPAGR